MNFDRKDRTSALLLGLSLALLGSGLPDLAFADTPAPESGQQNTGEPASTNSTSTSTGNSGSEALGTAGDGSKSSTASSSQNAAAGPGQPSNTEQKETPGQGEHHGGAAEAPLTKGEHPLNAGEHTSHPTPSATEHGGSSSAQAASTSSGVVPSHPAQKPVKLYGRIEELCAVAGARLPLKMKAMVPIRDSSLDGKQTASATTLAGSTSAAQQNYPVDYIGSWAGDLTVYTSSFDRTYFQRDPEEAKKESQIMRSGAKGQYSVTFYQGNNNRIQMQPSQVIFNTTESMGSQMQLLSKSQPGLGAMFGANNPMAASMANMQVPVMVALHMGTPISSGEIGVSGNQLSSQLMKNTLKQLSAGVLENQIVTRDRDRNPETGKVQEGFSESVLRFTKLNRDQLYLQAAYVYYTANGQFQAKYVLYGTLNRSNGARPAYPSAGANPMNIFGGAGAGGNPFGAAGNPFGGGGAGALQQQMQQMQKMLQQMNGQ